MRSRIHVVLQSRDIRATKLRILGDLPRAYYTHVCKLNWLRFQILPGEHAVRTPQLCAYKVRYCPKILHAPVLAIVARRSGDFRATFGQFRNLGQETPGLPSSETILSTSSAKIDWQGQDPLPQGLHSVPFFGLLVYGNKLRQIEDELETRDNF